MNQNSPVVYHTKHLKSVFAPVVNLSFSAAQENDFVHFLEEQQRNTVIEPISDIQQLLLRPDGAIAESGYRFNPIGFSSVAAALTSGLNSVFNELSGETQYRHASGEAAANLPAAVSVFNTVLQANFERIQERNILINSGTGTIEGFLGLDHKLLPNSVFSDIVSREMTAQQGASATFYRAEVVGRDVRIYYSDANNKWNYTCRGVKHMLGGGWYFSNREDSGSSVRAAAALLSRFGLGLAVNGNKNSVRHSGADIVGRASLLVSRIAAKNFYSRLELEPALKRLSRQRLYKNEHQRFDDVIERWVAFLLPFKISKDDAKNICKSALLVGADIAAADPLSKYDQRALAARTMYDLFCAVLRYARGQYYTTRELLQKTALDIVLLHVENKERLEG